MKLSDLETVDLSQPLTIHEGVSVAAKWWADHLRRIPNASKPRGPLPLASTQVRLTNVPLANVVIDGLTLTPENIAAYEQHLAVRMQILINAGELDAMRTALSVQNRPGRLHDYAMREAGFNPSMTMLPWGARMWIWPDEDMRVAACPGDGAPIYRVYPDAEHYERPRATISAHERRIRRLRAIPVDGEPQDG
jgi:hypothetical protein